VHSIFSGKKNSSVTMEKLLIAADFGEERIQKMNTSASSVCCL
jgi:hypothetical protein